MPWPLRTVYYCKIIVSPSKEFLEGQEDSIEKPKTLLNLWFIFMSLSHVWSLLKIETNKTERRQGLYQDRMQRNYKPRTSALRTKYERMTVCQLLVKNRFRPSTTFLTNHRRAHQWKFQSCLLIAWKIWNLIGGISSVPLPFQFNFHYISKLLVQESFYNEFKIHTLIWFGILKIRDFTSILLRI